MKWVDFVHADTNSWELTKISFNDFMWGEAVSQERVDELSQFFAASDAIIFV